MQARKEGHRQEDRKVRQKASIHARKLHLITVLLYVHARTVRWRPASDTRLMEQNWPYLGWKMKRWQRDYQEADFVIKYELQSLVQETNEKQIDEQTLSFALYTYIPIISYLDCIPFPFPNRALDENNCQSRYYVY